MTFWANAPHMKHWPRWAQHICGLIGHQDRNYSDGEQAYAYCLRCGLMFGNPWDAKKALTKREYMEGR